MRTSACSEKETEFLPITTKAYLYLSGTYPARRSRRWPRAKSRTPLEREAEAGKAGCTGDDRSRSGCLGGECGQSPTSPRPRPHDMTLGGLGKTRFTSSESTFAQYCLSDRALHRAPSDYVRSRRVIRRGHASGGRRRCLGGGALRGRRRRHATMRKRTRPDRRLKAPEVDDPSAELARQRLQRRIQSGEVVIQRGGKDRYGRTHGRLFVNGNRITKADLSPGSGGRRRN